MKNILKIAIVLIALSSCKNEKPTLNGNLKTQKVQLEKQIDSLNKLLVNIDKELGKDKEEEIPEIDAKMATIKNFEHYIELQGNIDTDGNVMAIPEAMGKVMRIYKNEGDKVRKGQVIMLLDNSLIRNQIAEVQTQYSLAKTAYDRQKRLWDQKIGSEMAYLQAKTQKNSLARKLNTLRSQMAKFNVKSPITGTLDDLMIKEGEMAAPQRPVARVVNLSKVYAQADVSEKYLPSIRKGTQVIIDFPELNKTVQSTVSSVGSFIHPNNRTFKIRIDLLNLDHSLKPNLTGNIKIKDLAVKDALVLPLSMVQEDRNGNNYVFVLQPIEGEKDVYKVVKKVLELGQTYKDEVIVKSGLSTDDILAMQGARGLTEGDKVKISNLEALTAKQETLRQKKQVENKMHTVQKGETLYRIHKKYNVPLTDLRKWNHLKNDKVKVGQKLIVQSKKNQ